MPSVQLEIRGDPNTSRPQSRGFEADVVSNSRLDGLNVVSTTPYPAEWVDNLQVLNGLAGAMTGRKTRPACLNILSSARPTAAPNGFRSVWIPLAPPRSMAIFPAGSAAMAGLATA
ncbi:hypothetical protein RAA17_21680 [Komagataeibacter rhaeticus]|nr:hypothetical protein [Komagataeibacter rhaeticus]